MPRPWLFLALCAVVFILVGCQVGPEEPKQGPPSIGISSGGGVGTLYKKDKGLPQEMGEGDVLRHFTSNPAEQWGPEFDEPKGMVAYTGPGGWDHNNMFRRYTKLNSTTAPQILFTGRDWWEPGQNVALIANPVDIGRDPYVDWDLYVQWALNIAKDTSFQTPLDQAIAVSSGLFTRGPHFVLANEEGAVRTHYWKFRLSPSFFEDDVARDTILFQLRAATGTESNTDIITLVVNGYNNRILMRHFDQGMGRIKTTVVFEVPLTELIGKWTAIEITMHFRDYSASEKKPGRENGYLYVKLTDMEGQRVLVEKGIFADMWRGPEVRNDAGEWFEIPDAEARGAQAIYPGFGLKRSIAQGNPPRITMDWTDYYLIDRNINNYSFPTGYDPKEAGPIPVRHSIEE